MADILRRYRCEPTPALFHANPAMVRAIMGPIGSGKSAACCIEIGLYRAQAQATDARGVRKTRWAAVRNTYPELKTTTIQTWKYWFPECVCPITYGSPIIGTLRYGLPDGTSVECEIYFMSMDSPADIGKLLSLELTGFWVNEAREIDIAIVNALLSRTGRYPAKADAPLTWTGGILDTNPPDDDHWWHRLAEVDHPEGWEFYRQPAAIIKSLATGKWEGNPSAENVRNLQLGFDYWLRMVRPDNEAWVKVYCCAEYGFVQDGRPVYPEYSDSLHFFGGPIPFEPRLPLLIGFDFGLTPAAVLCQYYPGPHRLCALKELVAENMGLDQFLDNALIPALRRDFKQIENLSDIIAVGDPAGRIRSPTDESTCYESLEARGFNAESGLTNELLPRIGAVKGFLTRLSAGKPALLISSECPTLRKGLSGKYRFKRIQVSGEERYGDQPVKDMHSHPQDAFQYVAMHVQGGLEIGKPKPPTASASAGRM